MRRLPYLLSIFLIFFLPFVILPIGVSQFEIPKVLVAEIAIEILVFSRLFLHDIPRLSRRILLAYGILFFLTFVDLLFFQHKYSFFGNTFRLQGIFLFWHLLLFSIFAEKNIFRHLTTKLLILFLVVQLCSDFVFGANAVGRSYGFLGEPNSFAAIAVIIFPLLFIKRSSKQLKVLAFLLVAAIIAISGSKSAVMAVFIESFFLFSTYILPQRVKGIFAVSVILCLLTLLTPFLASDIHESRVEIWYAALLSFLHHPLIGGGFGNIDLLLHKESLTFASFISARYVDSSHNLFLDLLVQSGIAGFIAFFLLLISSFVTFFRRKDTLAIALLIGILVMLSFNPVSVWVLIVFWYIVGQGVLGNAAVTRETNE